MEPGGSFKTIVEDDMEIMEDGRVVGYLLGEDTAVNQEAEAVPEKEVQ